LIAYRDRRPAIVRDIADVHTLARDYGGEHLNTRIRDEAMTVLADGRVALADVGAWLLGRDIAHTFDPASVATMTEVLAEVDDGYSDLIDDVVRQGGMGDDEGVREQAAACFRALRHGMANE